jgi:hypothetical protein
MATNQLLALSNHTRNNTITCAFAGCIKGPAMVAAPQAARGGIQAPLGQGRSPANSGVAGHPCCATTTSDEVQDDMTCFLSFLNMTGIPCSLLPRGIHARSLHMQAALTPS